jgi:hypothetical protein
MAYPMAHPLRAEVEACIRACQDCHAVCLASINHCLHLGGHHAEADHICLLLDCAAACAVSIDLMLRGSDFAPETCGLCADICIRCAADCDRLSDDPMMQHCADLCRRCADACRRMSGPEIIAAA